MVNGRREVLTGVSFTDTTIPVVKDDPILPNAGALLLLDASTFDAAVPAPGALLPNLAWRQAKAAIGSGDATTLAGRYDRSATFATSDGKIERTAKGGIHFISSQTAMAAGRGGQITAMDAIKSYILANLSHGFYFGAWLRLTRAHSSSAVATRLKLAKTGSSGYNNAVRAMLYRNNSFISGAIPSGSGNGVANIPSQRSISPAVVGDPQRVGMGHDGPIASPYWGAAVGTTVVSPPATIAEMDLAFTWGAFDSVNSGNPLNQSSQVFYRMYFEDLTLSGRTAAQVDAADTVLFNAAFATGGRFASDTYTDPATIA